MKWVISEMFYPDEVSTALIMTEIAEKFAEEENVGVICGPSGYEKSYKAQDRNISSNINIHRINVGNWDKNKIFTRVIRLLLLTIKMTWKIAIKVKRNDRVFIVTNPIFLLFTIAILKKLKGFHLSILVHDVFPDNLVPADVIEKDSFKFKVLSWLFNWTYRAGDKIIALGDDMKELLAQKIGTDSKITVIPNWTDPNLHPIRNFSSSKYYGIDLDNKIIITFAGNLGRVQGLLEFINCFIDANNPNLQLILVGDGALKPVIEKKIKQESITNIFLAGSRSRSEQLEFLNACDIGLITLKEGMKGLGVPSKTYNIMGVEKPILYIGDKNSEVDRHIAEYNCGWSFNWSELPSLTEFLSTFEVGDSKAIQEHGANSLLASLKHYSKKDILKRFNEVN